MNNGIFKNKILFISLHTIKNREKIDLDIYKSLKLDTNIDFAAASYKFKSSSSNIIYEKKFINDKEFQEANTIWFENFFQIKLIILNYDIIVLSNLKSSKFLTIFCKKMGKKVIIIDGRTHYDTDKNIPADLFLFKNNYAKKKYLIEHKNNKDLNSKSKVVGLPCTFVDESLILSKKQFYKKFKIKKKEKLVLFLPNGPQYFLKREYRILIKKIKDIMQKNNFKIIVKHHPTFSNKKKIERIKKIKGSNLFFKIKKYMCEDKYFLSAIKHSDIIITISSNSTQIVNYYKKPIYLIDRQRFLADINEEYNQFHLNKLNKKSDFYNKLLSKEKTLKIRKYSVCPYLKNNSNSYLVKTELIKDKADFKFYGLNINIEKLDNFIKKKKYIFKPSKKNSKQTNIISKLISPFNNMLAIKNIKREMTKYNMKYRFQINNYNKFYFVRIKLNLFFFMKKILDKLNLFLNEIRFT